MTDESDELAGRAWETKEIADAQAAGEEVEAARVGLTRWPADQVPTRQELGDERKGSAAS